MREKANMQKARRYCSARDRHSKLTIPLLALLLFTLFGPIVPVQAGGQNEKKLPEPEGFVNDFADVIDKTYEQRITAVASKLKEASGAEIAVVTVKNLEPYGSIEEYSIELAEKWQVGQKEEDNGIIMLLAMEERNIRMEVGYGLEGAIPDSLAGNILENSIIPPMQNGNYGEGFLKGSEAVAGLIAEEYGLDMGDLELTESSRYRGGAQPSDGGRGGEDGGVPVGLLIFLFIFFFGGGRIFWPLLFLGGLTGGRHYRGGFGSSGMGGFGGGGFSGFGGGGFGGGGASGSF